MSYLFPVSVVSLYVLSISCICCVIIKGVYWDVKSITNWAKILLPPDDFLSKKNGNTLEEVEEFRRVMFFNVQIRTKSDIQYCFYLSLPSLSY